MISDMKKWLREGEKVYIRVGEGSAAAIYKGLVHDVDLHGVWIDEGASLNGVRIVDYVSYEDITDWAVE